jgi:hypothetical protein
MLTDVRVILGAVVATLVSAAVLIKYHSAQAILLVAGGALGLLVLIIILDSLIKRNREHSTPAAVDVTAPRVNMSFALPRVDPNVPMVTRRATSGPAGAMSLSGTSAGTISPGYHGPAVRADEYEIAAFVFASVVNNQSAPGVGLTAKDARCTVDYFAPNGRPLLANVKGRWRDSPSALELSPYRLNTASEALDIPADGEPRELDLIFKYIDEAYVFAYNNRNASADGARLPTHRITELEFIAEVTVGGSNFKELKERFTIKHGGIGTTPSVQREPPDAGSAGTGEPAPA